MSFHLLQSSFISFINTLYIAAYSSCICLLDVWLSISYSLEHLKWNCISDVSLMCSLLVYRNIILVCVCVLILYSAILLTLPIQVFLKTRDFLSRQSRHLQTGTVVFLPFQTVWLHFRFFPLLYRLEFSVPCWIRTVKMGIFAIFTILQGKQSVFHHYLLCQLQILFVDAFIKFRKFPSF